MRDRQTDRQTDRDKERQRDYFYKERQIEEGRDGKSE